MLGGRAGSPRTYLDGGRRQGMVQRERPGDGAGEGEEDVEREMERVAQDPPADLEDWPGGRAKYKTLGGPESESGYGEGPTAKLGPADLRRHEDGSVEIAGEKVPNPDDYKREPVDGEPPAG
jgi:hypothetical protein